jgi:ATP-dependent protease ClpP protease subunit/8-oxo-dGTP pyrophosphatase MutT (NUDIX family)
MKILNIEGVISSKADAEYFAEGEKYFSYDDLEDFISNNYGEPFEAVIKSPGGSVEEGFRIYDKLKSLQVTTVAIVANSIASVIFLAGKVRKVTESTEMIIHNAWVAAESLSGEKLNVHSLGALSELFAATDSQILNVYTQIAGDAKATKLLALMGKESRLDAKMALDFGFATELVDNTYSAISFKNKVLTFSRNQVSILALQDGPLTTYADVVYLNKLGEVLLLQRLETDDFEPLTFGFPGGKVMQGETINAAAIREFKEETGIELKEVTQLAEIVNEDESLSVYFYAVGNEPTPTKLTEHKAAAYTDLKSFKGLAFIKGQEKRFTELVNKTLEKTNMKTEEKITAFEKAMNAMKNIFKVQMKNMVMTTDAGVSIFIEGEGDMLGKTVYIAEDGLPTETLAPAGPHSFADGSSVVLDESGVVIEVLPAAAPEAAMEEVEALQSTIAAMEDDKMKDQASIVALNAKVAAQAKVIAESNTKLTKLAVDFKDLKNMVNGDPDTKKKSSVIPAAEFAKLSTSEQIRQRAMNKV